MQDLPADINPGIRNLVETLNQQGFRTVDSGDGETHLHECDRPYGYVSILVDHQKLVTETDRLSEVLGELGIAVAPQQAEPPPEGTCVIQASYDPANRIGIVDVIHVHDRMIEFSQ